MFNFIGTHKIGILGDASSGKTVFLTSLLWNLEEGKLRLGAVREPPTDVKIHKLNDQHAFDYAGSKRKCKNSNKWPAKTTSEYSVAKCSYKPHTLFQRDLTFVDIPGERMADLLIWQCFDYAEWSAALLQSWRESDTLSTCMQEYVDLLAHPDTSKEKLARAYKRGMRELLRNYIPQISPSTLFFNDGRLESMGDINDDSWLENRNIWQHGDDTCDFFPLPPEWEENADELYASCRKNFNLYRKVIIKPLFSQIGSCDHFIICIDVLGILAQSPGAFLKTKEELEYFFTKITPGFLGNLWNCIGGSQPRVAFVATKSDLVYGTNLQRLKDLLEELVKRFVTEKIQFGYFTCTAWTSTKEGQGDARNQAIVNVLEEDENGTPRKVEAVLQCPPLPEEWPDDWDGADYARFTMDMLPSVINANPPRQTGIDAILNFITGDDKE